jgi:3-oxoadipate enol-lactonase
MPFCNMTDGVRLYYETLGAGEPLLLLPGQAQDHHAWIGLRDDFAKTHQVIVFDPRGTGASDKPAEPAYSTRIFARDAIALLDELGIPRSHIYGISLGGRVCQWLAIEFAPRVGAVVLGCTTPGNRHGVPRPPEVDAIFHELLWNPKAMGAMLELLLSPEWIAAHPEYVNGPALMGPPLPRHARKLHYLASEAHDSWDQLPGIARPVLVIHGSNDRVNMTANAPLLAARIPNAELHIVEGGRHLYHVEFCDEAGHVVRDFLRRHALAS